MTLPGRHGRTPQEHMAPVVVIPGLLCGEETRLFYEPWLNDPTSPLSSKERFLPIPKRGIGTYEELEGPLEEKFLAIHERLDGEPLVLKGHSLGGLASTKLALKHPDKIAAVVAVAGAQEGKRRGTPSTWALRHMLGNPEFAKLLNHDSDLIVGHKKDMAQTWSPNVSLHLLSPTIDDLLLFPQGLGVRLPEGQAPKRRVVTVPTPWLKNVLQHAPFIDEDIRRDIGVVPARRITGHIDIAVAGATIEYGRRVRRAVAMNALPPYDHSSSETGHMGSYVAAA